MVRVRKGEKDFYLSFKFVVSLFTLLRLIYSRFEFAAILTICSFLASGGYEVANNYSGTIIGDFYMALIDADEKYFWTLVWKATLIYFGQTLLLAISSLITWLLYISMRKNLVTALHKMYFRRNAYYQLNSVDNAGIDNPDQRITQDVERFCSTLTNNIFPYILIFPGVIGYYTYKTWVTAGPFGVGIVYLYFLAGVIANRLIVSPLTKWTARVEKAEGNFRFKHVSVRNNAEESAFYGAAEFDESECNRSFTILMKKQFWSAIWRFPPQFLQNFFDYYGGVMSYLIQVFPVFIFHSYKDMDPGTLSKQISNNAFFFIYLINSFTRLTDLALSVGEMAGYSQRISEMVNYLQDVSDDNTNYYNCAEGSEQSQELLITENLSFSSPSDPRSDLVTGLNLVIPKNKTLLITGSSGVGKTSFLRVLKKLWEPRAGMILRRFNQKNSMFLPQRPYFPTGWLSIRQQILFPRLEEDMPCVDMENERILNILRTLRLTPLIPICGGLTEPTNFEWQDTLSPGEQQRLSIARVLFHKPPYVFMDESTSSLSVEDEAIVYNSLKENGISYASTGHRKSLKDYHDWELRLCEKRGWSLITDDTDSKL